jgi:hypothetical protein
MPTACCKRDATAKRAQMAGGCQVLGIYCRPFLPGGKRKESSFLKKRTKKLLSLKAATLRNGPRLRSKSFLLLFFKKEVLPPSLP